jgi:hypothetical protein
MAEQINHIRGVLDAGYDYPWFGQIENVDSSDFIGWTTRFWIYKWLHVGILGNNGAVQKYLDIFEDSAGNTPYQDGVTPGSPNFPTNTIDVGLRHYNNQMSAMKGYLNNSPGTGGISSFAGMAGDHDTWAPYNQPNLNSPSGLASLRFYPWSSPVGSSPANNGMQGSCNNFGSSTTVGSTNICVENVPYCGEGNGVYETTDISMGRMRGFNYPINSNGIWPSSQVPSSHPSYHYNLAGQQLSPGGDEYLENYGEISVGGATIY